MRKLSAFISVSLDGYFADANGDVSWAHRNDEKGDFQAFVEGNAKGGSVLVFGRKTYDMMVRFWPTPMATQMNPVVAERMNGLPKVVFSRTMDEATWSNTTLLKGDLADEVKKLKSEPGDDMTILGSGSIVRQLAEAGLLDELQVVVVPIALGGGQRLFDGIAQPLNLKLASDRSFSNGNVFLCYEPTK